MSDVAITSTELERLRAVEHHMAACRSLLGVPDDEVLYVEIERLRAACVAMREALEMAADYVDGEGSDDEIAQVKRVLASSPPPPPR